MRYNSSCQAIRFWESFCIAGLKTGITKLTKDSKTADNPNFYIRKYHLYVKSSIYPIVIKFVYDTRDNTDRANLQVALDDLILIIEALLNNGASVDAGKYKIDINQKDGFVITEK